MNFLSVMPFRRFNFSVLLSAPSTSPMQEEIAVDRQFLLIGLAVSLASGILFGIAPALQA